jgi:glycosyltransferase involved in cell wall biosynthesis
MLVVFVHSSPLGSFPDILEYMEALQEEGVDVSYVQCISKSSKLEGIRAAATKIKALKPDIVHVFHFRGSGLLPLLVREQDVKWIIDIRTVQVENRHLEPEKYVWLKSRITWLEAQFFHHIFALTPSIETHLRPSIRPINIVPLGASEKRLKNIKDKNRDKIRSQLSIPLNAKVFLYSGSLSPSRRIEHIIYAFAKLCEVGTKDVFLLFIGGIRAASGETEKRVMNHYHEVCRKLGIEHQVLFTGWLPYLEAINLYAAADIGIAYLPEGTPYRYQPPTKLIEYMMAGILPIGNKVPSIMEFISDGLTGILHGNTVEGMAQGMRQALEVLEAPEMLRHIVQQAYEKVKNRDWSKIVKNHVLPVYRELLK